ncbi:hypothetical protein FA95DRAFT_124161 [Auriscalpium vulgare]|uniref:Uncharacterized protein n=1 Tax=Auriscalpium vulgare TaxID=40419 RepID=A0ACB8RMI5_9AGAM|nr:hypothetical protein FA95DRAFT_124161 [Auriscalpium vulgare]
MDVTSARLQSVPPAAFWEEVTASRLAPGQLRGVLQFHDDTIRHTSIQSLNDSLHALHRDLEDHDSRTSEELRAMEEADGAIQSRLRDQRQMIERAIHRLSSQYYHFLPISRLPHEVLSEVFKILWIVEPPCRTREAKLGWITVTHVCRLWRQLSLDDPMLWQRISCDLGPDWVKTMFERAQSVPLCVEDMKPLGRILKPFERRLIIDHIPSIRELSLYSDGESRNRLDEFVSPALSLERLDVCFSTNATVVFPPNFLDNCAPNLRSLRIVTSSKFPWRSPLLCGLTVLSMERPDPAFGVSSPMQDILDGLQNMPNLVELSLDLVLSTDGTPQRSVSLPNMKALSLHGSLHHLYTLLRYIHLPVTCKIKAGVSMKSSASAREQIHVEGMFAPRLVEDGGQRDVRTLSLHSFCLHDNREKKHRLTVAVSPGEAWPIIVKFKSRKWLGSGRTCRIIRSAIRLSGSPHLEELTVNNIVLDDDTWTAVASECPDLRILKVRGAAAISFFKFMLYSSAPTTKNVPQEQSPAMTTAHPESRDEDNATSDPQLSPIHFPALSSLSLRELHLDGYHVQTTLPYPGPDQTGTVDVDLPRWLAQRARDGHALARLRLGKNCRPTAEYLEALRQVVPDTTSTSVKT